MTTRVLLFAGAMALTGCGSETAYCEGPTAFAWNPENGELPGALPDDVYAEPASTPTGMRLKMDDSVAPWLAELPEEHIPVYRRLDGMEGWSLNGAAALRFTGALSEGTTSFASPSASDSVQLLDLGDPAPRRIPVLLKLTDEKRTLMVVPLVPLRPNTRHAVLVRSAFGDAQGRCLAPGASLRSMLEGAASARLAPLVERMRQALSAAGLARGEVGAAAVFTTQSLDAGDAIAADIRTRTLSWAAPAACTDEGDHRECSRKFVATDERVPGPAERKPLELTAHVWLPKGFAGARPFILWGHGIANSSVSAGRVAAIANPLGAAVVATDAPCHGDHPGAYSDGTAQTLCFVGLFDEGEGVLKPLSVRENIRLAVFERLQLLRLLDLDPDVDGDGAPDLDTAREAYGGESLGGIVGWEVVAHHVRFGAAIMFVTGAPMSVIVGESLGFTSLLIAMRAGATDGDVDRLLPVAQVLLDLGDPASFAPRVRAQRDDAGLPGPHLLLAMAHDDTTISNHATYDLSRALGIPRTGMVRGSELLVPNVATPLSGNAAGGRTAGLFEYDRTTHAEGEAPGRAIHGATLSSREAGMQVRRFLEGWIAGETPRIVDPYVEMGTPPLPGGG